MMEIAIQLLGNDNNEEGDCNSALGDDNVFVTWL